MGPRALQPRRHRPQSWGSVCSFCSSGGSWPSSPRAVHAAYYLLGGGAINAVGHRWGRRPYENKATNNQWLAWLVVGEGLHNNHHAAATSSRLSLGLGEVDPAWWCIRFLVRLRWAILRTTTRDPKVGPTTYEQEALLVGTSDEMNTATRSLPRSEVAERT